MVRGSRPSFPIAPWVGHHDSRVVCAGSEEDRQRNRKRDHGIGRSPVVHDGLRRTSVSGSETLFGRVESASAGPHSGRAPGADLIHRRHERERHVLAHYPDSRRSSRAPWHSGSREARAIRGSTFFTPPISSTLPRSVTSLSSPRRAAPSVAQDARDRKRQRDAGVGPSWELRRPEMDVHLDSRKVVLQSQAARRATHVRVGGVHRLAHHVAELTGDRQYVPCPAAEPRSS